MRLFQHVSSRNVSSRLMERGNPDDGSVDSRRVRAKQDPGATDGADAENLTRQLAAPA